MIIKKEDFISKGYNLESVLNDTGYVSINEAIIDWLESVEESIFELVVSSNGIEKTEELFSKVNEVDYSLEYKYLKKAMIEQGIFFLENGDISASSLRDNTKKKYSDKTFTYLVASGFVKVWY